MPIVWLKTSWPPPWRRRGSVPSGPLARLVRHFLQRLIRGGSADAEFEMGIGLLLGLLAAPGAFQSFLLLDKYSTFLDWYRRHFHVDYYTSSASDKYLFLSLAMAITGIVTALKWDRILPDSQDYLNLAPLPVRARTVLLANAAAIGFAVLVFAVDVNAASMVFFPLFVTAAAQVGPAEFLRFAAIHGLCLMLASLFTFCAVFAALGTLAAVLPRQVFRAWSSWFRGAILVGFLMLLLSTFAGLPMVERLVRREWLPSFWYLGLYQVLQHRPTPQLAAAAHRALTGFGAVFVWMVLAYAVSYRRRYAGVLEGSRRRSQQHLFAAVFALLDLFAERARGFQRAGYRFVVRALLRNEGHRLCVVVAIGLGWLLALQTGSPLEGSLIAAYLLVLGLRLAFELPAAVSANWIFRASLDHRDHESHAMARRVMLSFLVPLVVLPSLAWAWWRLGWVAGVLHALYVLALAMCLVEILLAGYRKIPLTCPMPGFRDNLPLVCVLQILGFEAFTHLGAALEQWMIEQCARFLLVPAALLAAWQWNRSRLREAREAGELETGLTFESVPPPVMERLKLSDAD